MASSMFLLESIFKISILTRMTLPVVLPLKSCLQMLDRKEQTYRVQKQY